MSTLARLVLRHRRIVLGLSLVALIVGGGATSKTANRLSFDFSLPGQPGYETAKQILATYGNGGEIDPTIPVITLPAGQTVDSQRAELGQTFATVAQQVPGVRVVDYATTGDRAFVTADGRSTFALVFPPVPRGFVDSTGPAIEAAVKGAAPPGSTAVITGFQQLAAGNSGSTTGPSVLLETLLGAAGALAVLIFVFASFLAIIPMVVAAVSILTTFLLLYGLTYLADVSFIVQFLVSLIGLGVSIDYSLLIVSRWREERGRGRPGRAGGAAGAVPALDGIRRHAHPAGGHAGLADVAAGHPRRRRTAAGLARHPQGAGDQPRLGGMGAVGGAPALDRGRGRRTDPGCPAGAVLPDQDRRGPVVLAGLRRPGVRRVARAHRPRGRHRRADADRDLGARRRSGRGGDREPRSPGDRDRAGPDRTGLAARRQCRGAGNPVGRNCRRGQFERGHPGAVRGGRHAGSGWPGRRRRAAAGLPQGGLRQLPARTRAHRRDHVRAADARLPLGRAATESRSAQPVVGECRLRRDGVLLAGGPRVDRRVRRPAHRRHHVLAADPGVRVPVRAVDGLRGLHPGADPGGVRRHRLHQPGGGRRPGQNWPAGDVGGTDSVPVLRRLGILTGHRHQGLRHRPGSGHLAGRDPRPGAAGPGAGCHLRQRQLVAAPARGDGAAGGALVRRS